MSASTIEDVAFAFEANGNEAILKYKAALPLTPEEAAIIGGVDLDIWEIDTPRINMWQMGRKDKHVNVTWKKGVMTGHVEDTGGIHKEYLYQVEVKFTRKQRIAVGAVLEPVIIRSRKTKLRKKQVSNNKGEVVQAIFITDPHFGFRIDPFSAPIAFHNRIFLSDLLAIATTLGVDYIIWGGDILDLADFSRFPTEPAIVQKTQLAGIEAAWLLNRFSSVVHEGQKVIEGNHDIRMPKAMLKNFSEAFELRPVHDLDGERMISVPRFLGFDQRDDIEWIGDYPNGCFDLGDGRFMHGDIARKGSFATVQTIIREVAKTTYFGHIHRYEKASRWVDGIDQLIEVGCPGCACLREYTPGSKKNANWNNGAFVITMKDGVLQPAEDILHRNGETYFRGVRYKGDNYLEEMVEEIPEKYLTIQ